MQCAFFNSQQRYDVSVKAKSKKPLDFLSNFNFTAKNLIRERNVDS